MNEQSARQIAARIPATPGVEVRLPSRQAVAPNGKDVIWEWSVTLTMRDVKSGNVVVREIRDDAADIDGAKVVKELIKEMKARRTAANQRRLAAASINRE